MPQPPFPIGAAALHKRARPDPPAQTELPMLYVFDCDGVLVDSEIIASQVDAELLAEVGYRDHAGRGHRALRRPDRARASATSSRPRSAARCRTTSSSEQKAEIDRRLAADLEGGARRPRDARPARRAALRLLQFVERAAADLAREDAALRPLRAAHLLGGRGRRPAAEAGAQRLSPRHQAVRRRPARGRRARGFGVRRARRPRPPAPA